MRILLKFKLYFLKIYKKSMPCKVKGCSDKHDKHYCRVCSDCDSTHPSRHCPKGINVYHGTKKQFADLISQNGFKASPQGRIGPGVYFTLNYGEAKRIAKHRFPKESPVVIECRAIIHFTSVDTSEEMEKKIQEWKQFQEKTAVLGLHPPWAKNEEFKQVCVRNPKRISIVDVHKV